MLFRAYFDISYQENIFLGDKGKINMSGCISTFLSGFSLSHLTTLAGNCCISTIVAYRKRANHSNRHIGIIVTYRKRTNNSNKLHKYLY